jgi:hypothetical protein
MFSVSSKTSNYIMNSKTTTDIFIHETISVFKKVKKFSSDYVLIMKN